MNRFFSERLNKLKKESGLSYKQIISQLMDLGVCVSIKTLRSWFEEGKIPDDFILEALAKIFSQSLKREVKVEELLGKANVDTKLKFKTFDQDQSAVEIIKNDKYIGSIYLIKDEIVLVCEHLGESENDIKNKIKINCRQKPPCIKIKILGGER